MADGIKITPNINSKGLFEVQEPYRVNVRKVYEVIAIRELEDLFNEQINVYQAYYEPFGISEEIYERDVNNKVSIVSLLGAEGVLFIPDTFIISYPELGLANYQGVIISADMGAVHKSRNLSALLEDIAELCSKHTGIKPTVRLHTRASTNVLTIDEGIQLEETRKGLIQVPESYFNKYGSERNRNNAIIQANNAKLAHLLGKKKKK